MQPLDNDSLQELARTRVAQADTKTLKKIQKDFYRLVNPSTSSLELHAAHASFIVGLDQLTQQLSKKHKIAASTQEEVENYENQARATERLHEATTERLAELSKTLERAQRDRGRTIEYDHIAKDIGKLPDRSAGLQSCAKLEADIQLLEGEREQYTETKGRRRREFGEIVDRLGTMSEAISEEKNEQERRRALDDGEAEEPPAATLDPTAPVFEPSTTPGENGDDDRMDADEDERGVDEGEPEPERDGDDVMMAEGAELEEGQEREEKEDGETE